MKVLGSHCLCFQLSYKGVLSLGDSGHVRFSFIKWSEVFPTELKLQRSFENKHIIIWWKFWVKIINFCKVIKVVRINFLQGLGKGERDYKRDLTEISSAVQVLCNSSQLYCWQKINQKRVNTPLTLWFFRWLVFIEIWKKFFLKLLWALMCNIQDFNNIH